MDVAGIKKNFFDRKGVTDRVDRAVARALSRFGAFVRTRSKSSLKYGKGTAPVGAPPLVHRSRGFTRKKRSKGVVSQQAASPLRELIFFGYDPQHKSVVVGPVLGGKRTGAPENLEHGKHPFMAPAAAAELDNLDGDFRNCVK